MDFSTLQTALPTLLSTLIGLPCQHATEPRKFITGPCAVVEFISQEGIGVDDRKWENLDTNGAVTTDPAAADTVRATQYGMREGVLQITAWSNDQRIDKSARFYLERLRTRLRMPSSLDALRAMGLAIVTIEKTVPLDLTEDGRVMSQASLDVRVGYGVTEADAAVPFIERYRLSADVRD
jgi:hypothetical protein